MDWMCVTDFEHSQICVSPDFSQIKGNTALAEICDLRRNGDSGRWEYKCPTYGWRECRFSPDIERALVQMRGGQLQ